MLMIVKRMRKSTTMKGEIKMMEMISEKKMRLHTKKFGGRKKSKRRDKSTMMNSSMKLRKMERRRLM